MQWSSGPKLSIWPCFPASLIAILYLDFGSKTQFAGTANQADVSFHDHICRAGINYAFNPAPLVAKC